MVRLMRPLSSLVRHDSPVRERIAEIPRGSSLKPFQDSSPRLFWPVKSDAKSVTEQE